MVERLHIACLTHYPVTPFIAECDSLTPRYKCGQISKPQNVIVYVNTKVRLWYMCPIISYLQLLFFFNNAALIGLDYHDTVEIIYHDD